MNTIYLDHNATTPLDPQVRAEMEAAFGVFGNPSSIHAQGQAARALIDKARARVAKLIGAQPDEVIFTSGGTESDNLAILGTILPQTTDNRRGVITSAIEHQAVLNPCKHLASLGFPATFLAVDANGIVHLEALTKSLKAEIRLVSVMLANNDTGVIEPLEEVVNITKARGALVHTDAVQAVGKIPVDVKALGLDFLSFSAHKLHGPMGVGALYIRRGVKVNPLVFGGHQERSLRPGTENVPGIVGFGMACELAGQRLEAEAKQLSSLRDQFEAEVLRRIPGTRSNGSEVSRLPNTTNIAFEGLDGEALAINLDLLGLAVSTGAACATVDQDPSHVLLAMGQTKDQASSALRFSFGRDNTAEEVEEALNRLSQAVTSIRDNRP
jgi:cysteine desulfurase